MILSQTPDMKPHCAVWESGGERTEEERERNGEEPREERSVREAVLMSWGGFPGGGPHLTAGACWLTGRIRFSSQWARWKEQESALNAEQFYALDPIYQRTEIPKLSHLLPAKITFHNNAKYASWLPRIHFSPHIAPEAIYFRSWLVKKNKNTIIAETKCYLHTPWSLKTNPCRRKRKIRRRRMKTTSSAKRVTQVRSAGGYKLPQSSGKWILTRFFLNLARTRAS